LIVSLWSIDDEKTQEFMINFYAQLLKTNNIINSFNQTQRNMREKYKNPFYWAGFEFIE
ncbi:MAG: CHAT domain-containing protein, partial [Ferruginibacter sp.]|nr:CHAT domain-containing protein [Ferruginibacter sp.]